MFDRLLPGVSIPLAAIVLIMAGIRIWAVSADQPAEVGVGDLAPCASVTSCVSSLSADEENRVPPFNCAGSPANVAARMIAGLSALPRTGIVTATETYVHAESKSLVFGFIDDIELRTDPEAGVIHVRSASRLGSGDLGKNAERVADLREALGCADS